MSIERFGKTMISARPLQDELDVLRANYESRILSPDVVGVMHRVRDELIAANSVPALRVGDDAPAFELSDQEGTRVASRTLLRSGPLVVTFYRGSWCPYCAFDLEAMEAARPAIEARGARIVAVSQEAAARSRRCREARALGFQLLRDGRGEIAAKFGVRWTVSADLKRVHELLDADLEELNADDSWTLSMPARFVIGRDGAIAYAATSADYTKRSEPNDLLPILDLLRGRSPN
jgi:peroxiredoxin